MSYKGLKKRKIKKEVEEKDLYEEQYRTWRKNKDKSRLDGRFFILYKDLEEQLGGITPGALKLYIYYGFRSNNETGMSFPSVERCAKYFNVTEKTINNWNKELISRGLIYRKGTSSKLNKETYLLPISTNIMRIEKEKIDEWVNHEKFSEAYGEPVNAFHIIQIEKDCKLDESENCLFNTLFVIYEKEYRPIKSTDPDEKLIKRKTIIEFKLDKSIYSGINMNTKVKDDIGFFNTCVKFENYIPNLNIDVKGIAVNSKIQIDTSNDSNIKTVCKLIEDLTSEDLDLEAYESITISRDIKLETQSTETRDDELPF